MRTRKRASTFASSIPVRIFSTESTFERFLDKLNGHKRCCINYDPSHFRLQALGYVGFIDVYH